MGNQLDTRGAGETFRWNCDGVFSDADSLLPPPRLVRLSALRSFAVSRRSSVVGSHVREVQKDRLLRAAVALRHT
jgi:hypothetical protein